MQSNKYVMASDGVELVTPVYEADTLTTRPTPYVFYRHFTAVYGVAFILFFRYYQYLEMAEQVSGILQPVISYWNCILCGICIW